MFAKIPFAKKSALALTLLSLFAPATNAQTMSFVEAWQQVLSQSDALAAKQASLDYAAQMEKAAYGYNLPSVSLGATYVRLDDSTDFKPSEYIGSKLDPQIARQINQLLPNLGASIDRSFRDNVLRDEIFNSSIRAVWPIFTGGKITAAQDIAAAKTDEAKYLLEMEQQAKFEDLSKVYFATVFAHEVLNTRIESERSLKKHLEHATKMEEQGQIARVERLQAEVSYDKAKTERKKAERDLEIANAALNNMVESDEDISVSSPLFTQSEVPAFSPFLNQTLASYPGLKVLDAKQEQANGLIKVERSKYAPNVYVFGNYDLHKGDSVLDQIKPDWMVGVGVNIPLVDNTGRSDRLKAAHSKVTQVNHLRSQAERDLSLLVEKNWREAQQALEEYKGLISSVELAKENLRLREKAFAQGLSTSLDVIDAELFVVGAKTQQLSAAYQYVLSLSRLLAVSGQMDDFSTYQRQAINGEVTS